MLQIDGVGWCQYLVVGGGFSVEASMIPELESFWILVPARRGDRGMGNMGKKHVQIRVVDQNIDVPDTRGGGGGGWRRCLAYLCLFLPP